jgi:CHAD domain-containing protein
MLAESERAMLLDFVKKSEPGAPFLRRARLLLLVDEGLEPERAAGQVGVSITQARNLMRVYRRQRLTLFPEGIFRPAPLFSAGAPIAEAARAIIADQLSRIREEEGVVRETAAVTAVHEMRKAIRALGTALKLFAPFFAPGLTDGYRQSLRKIMRRLGRSRDLAVCLDQLNQYVLANPPGAGQEDLPQLAIYWEKEKAGADAELQGYLDDPRRHAFWAEMARFSCSEGEGVAAQPEPWTANKVRHLAPALIYERLAAVRAFDDYLEQAPLHEMHRLRLRTKELRYTLQFFEPVMGATAGDVLATVKQLQEHLGTLNDARIALDLLDGSAVAVPPMALTHYGEIQRENVDRLMAGFVPLWRDFEAAAWRHKLATAVAAL